MEINLLLENIKKFQKKLELDTIDKKIIKNKDFIPLLKSNLFKNLNDFQDFYSELRYILEKCPNNKLGPNLLPIDPNTNLEINIDNIIVYNEMCYNINLLPNSNSKWKKLLGLFLVSLAGGAAMFKYSDKINSYLTNVSYQGNQDKLYNNTSNSDTLNNNIENPYDIKISYKELKKQVSDKIYDLYTYINPITYQKVFKDFGVHYNEKSSNLGYEDIFTMETSDFIKKYQYLYSNDKELSIDNKNKVEKYFRLNPEKFKNFLEVISDTNNYLINMQLFMDKEQIKNLVSSYLRKLLDLKTVMENKELYDTLLTDPSNYQKVFKDFGVYYSEISTNLEYEDIFTMEPFFFIQNHYYQYDNVNEILNEGLDIDNKNKVESYFLSNPHKFKDFLQEISDIKNNLINRQSLLTKEEIKDLFSSYLRKLVDLKTIIKNKELYTTLLSNR